MPVEVRFLYTYDVPIFGTEVDDVGLCFRTAINIDLVDSQSRRCGGGSVVAHTDTDAAVGDVGLVDGKRKGDEVVAGVEARLERFPVDVDVVDCVGDVSMEGRPVEVSSAQAPTGVPSIIAVASSSTATAVTGVILPVSPFASMSLSVASSSFSVSAISSHRFSFPWVVLPIGTLLEADTCMPLGLAVFVSANLCALAARGAC